MSPNSQKPLASNFSTISDRAFGVQEKIAHRAQVLHGLAEGAVQHDHAGQGNRHRGAMSCQN